VQFYVGGAVSALVGWGTELPVRGPNSPFMHLMHHIRHATCSQLNYFSEDVRIIAGFYPVVEI